MPEPRAYKTTPAKREAAKRYYAKNREAIVTKQAEYNARNRETIAKKTRDYRAVNGSDLVRSLGLPADWLANQIASQGHRCAICDSPEPKGIGGFKLDHDHATGEPRGALCFHCNVGLGHFRDNPDLLSAALRYLASPPARNDNETQSEGTP